MKPLILVFFIVVLVSIPKLVAQETVPIYSDYLSDNIYLLHPAAAGIGDCAKLRLTHRQQWSGNDNAPQLQTLSYHTKLKAASNVGLGGLVFNDKNGFHSQIGAQATFAYHVNMGGKYFNQLSFALSGMFAENRIDERNFILPGEINDPVIIGLIRAENYYNADFGLAYHYKTGFAYFTVKNLLLSIRNLETSSFESLNLRRYLLSIGYFFDYDNPNRIKLEPSTLIQMTERTGEISVDINLKAYKKLKNNNTLWATLSYRRSFDGNEIQELSQITPIIGMNFGKTMVSYTYTHQLGDIIFANGGYHQFTLGFDLFCKTPRANACPNINNSFN
ncbi:MAG: type IX secretion system membrane protein PorP/SprF [Flavobacteriaceae bacterium]|nr:type IX secretion system membrane protein PorP/SprF [Flavobacteriaceae bacterium]